MTTSFIHRASCPAFAALLLTCTVSFALRAQGTGLVASSELVYADIERLSELGALDSVVLGQRPYSRREIARIARVARARLDKIVGNFENGTAYADGLLRRLERFSDAPDVGENGPVVSLIDGASLSFVSTEDRKSTCLNSSHG